MILPFFIYSKVYNCHFSGLTAGTTFASALSYAFQKDTYQFKNRSYDHQSAKKLTALAAFAIFNIGFTTWHYDLLSYF